MGWARRTALRAAPIPRDRGLSCLESTADIVKIVVQGRGAGGPRARGLAAVRDTGRVAASAGSAPDDEARRRALRRAKAGATGLLLLAAATFAATYASPGGGRGFLGFVRAAAEAAMVGGLADWFAVTALFRHPLGLPVPHTALIPRRKDDIGASLAGFVQDNFLSPQVVADRLRDVRAVARAAEWLADPGNAARVTAQIARLLRVGLAEVRGDGVHASELSTTVARAATKRLAEASYAPLAGRLLAELVSADRHRPLVDLIVASSRRWLDVNEGTVVTTLSRLAPGWVPWFVKDPAVERVYQRARQLASDVAADPDHELRASVDELLLDYATRLQQVTPVAATFDRAVSDALGHPAAADVLADALDRGLRLLADLAEDPQGPLQEALSTRLTALGARVTTDRDLADRLEQGLERVATALTATYAGEFTALVSDTVARWDGADASRRIELQVGRDLQFIRVNGTVVGALAGVAIHAVAVVLGG